MLVGFNVCCYKCGPKRRYPGKGHNSTIYGKWLSLLPVLYNFLCRTIISSGLRPKHNATTASIINGIEKDM